MHTVYYKCVNDVETNLKENYGSENLQNYLITEWMNFGTGIKIIWASFIQMNRWI